MEQVRFAATIGTFDGVHRGHQYVLRQLTDYAHQHGMLSLAVTFDRPFRQKDILTPLDAKLNLIARQQVDRSQVLSFTPELRGLSAREFMVLLKERMGVSALLTGYDNRFGHNREEGFDDYMRYGKELDIDVVGLQPEGDVSSSRIREALKAGDVSAAATGLGRYYAVSGHVIHGHHIGTQLGFPTANLQPDEPQQLIPATGVYAVRATIDGQSHPAMMNIGHRPTFNGHATTLEVHLLHCHEDLYDRAVSVEFVSRLRQERRFDSAEALKAQLAQDAKDAEAHLALSAGAASQP